MGSGSLLLVSVSSRPVSAAHLIIPYTLMIKASEKKPLFFIRMGLKPATGHLTNLRMFLKFIILTDSDISPTATKTITMVEI